MENISDYLNKCRCCLENLDGKATYNITEFFMEKFFEVTQVNVNIGKKIKCLNFALIELFLLAHRI